MLLNLDNKLTVPYEIKQIKIALSRDIHCEFCDNVSTGGRIDATEHRTLSMPRHAETCN